MISGPDDAGLKRVDQSQLELLRSVVGDGPVLILTHDNPDPDALASGKALSVLFREAWGIPSDLRYSGLVARAENKAVLHFLIPEWQPMGAQTDFSRYAALALVDTQPEAGNNSLPADLVPQVVIDHHFPLREALAKVPFVNVQPEVGATASLVYQYLKEAGVIPDKKLATAIFYGIQADTRSLSRGDSQLDRLVYRELLDLLDRQLLASVEQARLSRDYFQAFSNGLQSARIYGDVAVAYLGEMHRPDFVAEMADLIVRLEGLRAVLCLGYHGAVLQLSLRTVLDQDDAGALIQNVVFPPGKAGGHGMGAGGQIPLAGSDPLSVVHEAVRRFLDLMGQRGEGEPLLM